MIKKAELSIHGMHCASCAVNIQRDLEKQPGVKTATINFALEQGQVEYDEAHMNPETIMATVKKSGYSAQPLHHTMDHAGHHANQTGMNQSMDHPEQNGEDHAGHAAAESAKHVRQRLMKVGLAAVLTVFIIILGFVLTAVPNRHFLMLLLSLGVLYAGREFFAIGYPNLLRGRPSMDTLVALGVSAAFLYSGYTVLFSPGLNEYFMDVGIIITFILLGRYLEAKAKGTASEAIRKLLHLSAKTAHRWMNDQQTEEIPINQIKIGDKLLVKPGEKIPTDGVIVDGSAAIDESMVTGESIPADKKSGDSVIGATINGNQVFTMRATQIGSQTVLAQIIKMVQAAQMSRAPIQKLVDKISLYFVWGVIVIAAITFISWLLWSGNLPQALIYTVAVLIIACPCALGLATPISIVVGTGRGASLGILIKNAESLEKMHQITAIAFDKTGTITKGQPAVQAWVAADPAAEQELGAALALETHSEHPLARSIIEWFQQTKANLKPTTLQNVTALPGQGMQGREHDTTYRIGNIKFLKDNQVNLSSATSQIDRYRASGHTIIGFSANEKLLGFFAVQDGIKATSAQAIASLHHRKIKTIMLTGDNASVAAEIAKQVGIDEVRAEVMPEDKVNIIKDLQAQGNFMAMVGDGINDSPALAQANVGIAMGTGTDIAMETSDVVLVKGDLLKASEAISLSQKTLANIKQNLFWAFIYNTVGLPIAALGFLNPAISAAAMAGSSISVVLNALRLKRATLK
ncbi:copper-translocating P-type ATPase [Candidatus Falkowbacteria bacterium]|nr:copper-translocating P-type ATPase [Candidatus Falkowbacteria bacterium]